MESYQPDLQNHDWMKMWTELVILGRNTLPTYHDHVPIAADAADWVGGRRGDEILFLLALLLFLLLLRGLVALIGTGVALRFLRVGHQVDEALERWAQLPLLVFFEAVVQSFVDHDTQRVDNLRDDGQKPCRRLLSCPTRKKKENTAYFISLG